MLPLPRGPGVEPYYWSGRRTPPPPRISRRFPFDDGLLPPGGEIMIWPESSDLSRDSKPASTDVATGAGCRICVSVTKRCNNFLISAKSFCNRATVSTKMFSGDHGTFRRSELRSSLRGSVKSGERLVSGIRSPPWSSSVAFPLPPPLYIPPKQRQRWSWSPSHFHIWIRLSSWGLCFQTPRFPHYSRGSFSPVPFRPSSK